MKKNANTGKKFKEKLKRKKSRKLKISQFICGLIYLLVVKSVWILLEINECLFLKKDKIPN